MTAEVWSVWHGQVESAAPDISSDQHCNHINFLNFLIGGCINGIYNALHAPSLYDFAKLPTI